LVHQSPPLLEQFEKRLVETVDRVLDRFGIRCLFGWIHSQGFTGEEEKDGVGCRPTLEDRPPTSLL
jgi:hypothetical protein